jgi:hypothetical protein
MHAFAWCEFTDAHRFCLVLHAEVGGCEPSTLLFPQRRLGTTVYPHSFSCLRVARVPNSNWRRVPTFVGFDHRWYMAGCTADLLFSVQGCATHSDRWACRAEAAHAVLRHFQQMTRKCHTWPHSSRGTPSVRHQRLFPVMHIAGLRLSDSAHSLVGGETRNPWPRMHFDRLLTRRRWKGHC